jgi:Polyketide cyclase / dehydrase and lipid transport
MWSCEHSVQADVAPLAIWHAWRDVDRWPEWNGDIARIELSGPFAVGSTIAMTPHEQDSVQLRLAQVEEGELFVDEAEVAGTTVQTLHRIDRLDDGRVQIVYRLEANGPAAEKIGPAISADFDETLAALIGYVRR